MDRPTHPLVLEGLRATGRPGTIWSGRADATVVGYDGHPVKRHAAGLTASIGAVSARGWLGEVVLRGDRFAIRASPLISDPSFAQTELWLAAGYATRGGGISVHYARIDDGASFTGPFRILGLVGRIRAFTGQFSASRYPDMMILRAAPTWRFSPIAGLGVIPGFAAQLARGVWRVSASLAADTRRGAWLFDAGVRFGDELRPADVVVPVVFNVPDVVAGGAWLGIERRMGTVTVGLRYAATRYRRAGTRGDIASIGHAAVLAASWQSREALR